MSLNSEDNRQLVIGKFPGLEADLDFKITSPLDTSYNCLAWAANKNDIWWWPNEIKLDGVAWPTTDLSLDFENLKRMYNTIKGYEECESWAFDINFKKIALYIDAEGNFTHAARQTRDGKWTSKLGTAWDITHGSPFTIEGNEYGKVGAIMQIKFY